ncbi:protease inhibitor I42 family protein [Kamptonema cortianum]|uniref:Protease inhibitor I42 family protein n=1 Tax=Geitlerinema calcuttense NRMC-F 0142 TaxID=2922238 RepID=A0ABT7LYY9_9CYAN|nr:MULTISPECIES: protease inhibitor I42 family protein [Cyanophyceae]MDK3156637.1 protease inhibitor I42 family protein [Kamptonema cortianum]MDL5050352.1 protease inhibitor I42 family protein [Oscillatoria amoena NRMC-F 0135]MDL5053376.1 protease inhibitor I42 family protein [Oscillatoria laete-virens NRMC-F 0139]MDL5056595.1 protease inhibitor I42 family protein [Geitlerinema calcuttense NRMC-F 0142]
MNRILFVFLIGTLIFAGCQSAHLPQGSRRTDLAPAVTGRPAVQLDGSSGAFHSNVRQGQSFSVTLPGGEAEGYGGFEWILRDKEDFGVVRRNGERTFVEPSADLMVPAYYDFPFVAVARGQQTFVFDLIRPGIGAQSPTRTAVVNIIVTN